MIKRINAAKPDEGTDLVEIATVRIELIDTDPPIWREVEVPTAITFKTLHGIVQIVMGWENYHMWEFAIGRQKVAASRILRDVLRPRRTTIDYVYDFGDCWEHKLVVTGPRPALPGVAYPNYVGGERNGPPEDCGGIPGFYDKLDALADPEHPDREEIVEWIGDYDPEAVDVKRIVSRLARIGKPRKPRAGKSDTP